MGDIRTAHHAASLGVDVVYREARGYSVVVDKTLFVAYSVPGSLALVLAIGLLGVVEPLSRRRGAVAQATCALGYVALALGSASLLGVIALFDPVFTAGRIFGTLALGVATTMAAVVVQQANVDRVWVIALFLLGALGVFLLPLWPLVYALQWVTAGQAASVIALFGVGWLAVAYDCCAKRIIRGWAGTGTIVIHRTGQRREYGSTTPHGCVGFRFPGQDRAADSAFDRDDARGHASTDLAYPRLARRPTRDWRGFRDG